MSNNVGHFLLGSNAADEERPQGVCSIRFVLRRGPTGTNECSSSAAFSGSEAAARKTSPVIVIVWLERIFKNKIIKRLFEILSGINHLLFIKTARIPQAFKPGDEWLPGAKPARAGGAESFRSCSGYYGL